MLATMLNGTNPLLQVDGAYFIDRCGDTFGFVLNYLRGGPAVALPDNQLMLQRLRNEADFYLLPG